MFERNPHVTAAVEAISKALMSLSVGDTLPYSIISQLAGEKVNSQSYVMGRALKRAEEATGALFENVHSIGYQRLPSHEIPTVGKKANTRIRRHARKARKRLEGIRANDLQPAEVAQVAAYRSHFGMIEGLAKDSSIDALAKSIDTSTYVAANTLADRMNTLMRPKK